MKILKTILIAAIFTFSLSCTSSNDFEKGKQQLIHQGYTNVTNTGYNMFCCDDKDSFSTGFRCEDRNGNIVEGCFCSSVMKGVTIRFE